MGNSIKADNYIMFHPLGMENIENTVFLKSVIKDSYKKTADNIVSIEITTDPIFPKHTLTIEINLNHRIEILVNGEPVFNVKEALDKFYSKTTSSNL